MKKDGSNEVLVTLFTSLIRTGDGKKTLGDAMMVAAKYGIVNEFSAALGETLVNVGSGIVELAWEWYRHQEGKNKRKQLHS